jgi:virginiamycin B lyase
MPSIRLPKLLAILLSLSVVGAAQAEDDAKGLAVEITEWEVPWADSRPRDPWYGPGDVVWFVGQKADYVARFDPDSEDFERFDLPEGAGPHTVIADEAGAWYAGNRDTHIGRLDPETGAIEQFPMPGDNGPRDPHTMAFRSDGDIWFTAQLASQVGLLDRDKGEITLFDTETPRARPYGLVVDDSDQPWFTLFGTNALGTVENGSVREIPLPRDNARPRRLAFTPDGMLWYVDYAQGYLGRYNPEDGAIDEWRLPGGGAAAPYAMGTDDRGHVWAVETGDRSNNRFVGFDPDTESFGEPVPVPSGGGTVRHMFFDAGTQSFWFGTDANTLGRARLR